MSQADSDRLKTTGNQMQPRFKRPFENVRLSYSPASGSLYPRSSASKSHPVLYQHAQTQKQAAHGSCAPISKLPTCQFFNSHKITNPSSSIAGANYRRFDFRCSRTDELLLFPRENDLDDPDLGHAALRRVDSFFIKKFRTDLTFRRKVQKSLLGSTSQSSTRSNLTAPPSVYKAPTNSPISCSSSTLDSATVEKSLQSEGSDLTEEDQNLVVSSQGFKQLSAKPNFGSFSPAQNYSTYQKQVAPNLTLRLDRTNLDLMDVHEEKNELLLPSKRKKSSSISVLESTYHVIKRICHRVSASSPNRSRGLRNQQPRRED